MNSKTMREMRNAIKQSDDIIKYQHKGEIRSYTIKQIIWGILAGAGLVSYAVTKGMGNLHQSIGYISDPAEREILTQQLSNLPFNAYFDMAGDWLKNEFIPKLRNFPELWNSIKPTNGLETVITAMTTLCAGLSIKQIIKRIHEKHERNAEMRDAKAAIVEEYRMK